MGKWSREVAETQGMLTATRSRRGKERFSFRVSGGGMALGFRHIVSKILREYISDGLISN